MDQKKKQTNSNKGKSLVKTMSKFTNRNSRENDKKRKKFIRDDEKTLGKKNISKKMTKRKKGITWRKKKVIFNQRG